MFTFNTLSRARRLAGACGFFFLLTPGLHAQERFTALRVLDPTLAAAFNTTYPDSPTIRELINEIEHSDLIVHVVAMPPASQQPLDGALRFVVRAGGRRFLRIEVNTHVPPTRLAATIGHELQHAVEVAREQSVVDQASMTRLYRRIGSESAPAGLRECFETDEAQRAGRRVIGEIAQTRAYLARGTPHVVRR